MGAGRRQDGSVLRWFGAGGVARMGGQVGGGSQMKRLLGNHRFEGNRDLRRDSECSSEELNNHLALCAGLRT